MSWVFGYATYTGRSIPDRFRRIHGRPRLRFESELMYLVCGGPERTCLHQLDGGAGWMACGLGIDLDDRGCRVWSTADWKESLSGKAPRFPRAGHFVAVRWSPDAIEVRTDALGLRTIFLCELGGGLVLSTRLDWMARAARRTTLDLEALGSRFLSFTQLSHRSGIEGIDRLGPGGIARYAKGGLEMAGSPWMPSRIDEGATGNHEPVSASGSPSLRRPVRGFAGQAAEGGPSTPNLAAALEHFVDPHFHGTSVPVSLGLSGGVDSRTMLALASGRPNLATHVFGYPEEPDVTVAQNIAEKSGLECRWIDSPLPEPDRCIDLLRAFAATASGFGFASDLIEKRHYAEICKTGRLLLFGLGGELLRRQFLNRFLMCGGRRALKRGDRDRVARLLIGEGAETLAPDALGTMKKGARQDVEAVLEAMPDAGSFGPENWADLLMVRFRVSNPHMAHQTLLDHLGCGYSPFEQAAVLGPLFSVPIKHRANSRLSRRIISKNPSQLTNIPLVMNDVTFPFWMSTNVAIVWTRFRTRRRMSFLQRARVDLLRHLEEPVRDLAFGSREADDPVYDLAVIRRLVDSFYGGDTASARPVEDWLTFTLFRDSMKDVGS